MYDILIIGGGPAGLTAALYARRAGKTVLVLEKNTFGGQIVWSPRVENFPGFPSITGLELGDAFMAQAMEAGAELELDEAISISRCSDYFSVETGMSGTKDAAAVIFATGAEPRKLGLPHEDDLIGAGISFCAVCDGEFFRGGTVAVVGGGNTALQEALYLADICKTVYLVHRREIFRADAALVALAERRENITLVCPAVPTALEGDGHLTGLRLRRTDDDTERTLSLDGLFVAVGHDPMTRLLRSYTELDEGGYALVDEGCATTAAGIFVAGDCRKKQVKQLTTAVSDGACAAIAACRYLETRP